jgi:hypothetical protein
MLPPLHRLRRPGPNPRCDRVPAVPAQGSAATAKGTCRRCGNPGSCVPTPLGAERVPDPAHRRIRRGPARCAVSSDDIPGWACALAAGGPTPTARTCVGITSLPSWTTHRRGCASSSATSLPGIAKVLPGPGRRDDTVSATPWSWSGWSPAPSGVHRPREARSLTAHQAAYSAGDGGSGAYLWKGLCSAQITEFRRLRDGC